MKLKELLKTLNLTIFKGTVCLWDSSFDDLESLCKLKEESLSGMEVYLKEE